MQRAPRPVGGDALPPPDDFLQGRPATGAGHYLRDIVFGANDGVVTTLAILAGSAGAGFPIEVAVVLGLANLVADGFSMAAGNYVSLKSELEQRGIRPALEHPVRHALAMLAAFVFVGAAPLVAYVAVGPWRLLLAALVGLAALATLGAWRAPLVRRSRLAAALELAIVGLAAAALAYAVGSLAASFVA